ncbi:MAG TPA: hypothetical protein VGO96_02270 [Pyrinomonadaceae bacterium]|jgi:hypothetical protein|nr:hypothetical protein [Pyrinomonadaceae bacterium]
MKTSKIICILIFALLCAPVVAQQQQQRQRRPDFEPLEPRTQLEELQLKIGAVIVRGSQRIGSVRGQAQGRLEVSALEVIDTAGRARARGLSLTIEEAGDRAREAVVFVDYDEVAGLLDGLESMIRLDRGETQLPNFEVSYRTKGDLVVSVFSTRSGIVRCVISGGPYAPATVTFPSEEIGNLRALIATAKNRLDEIRAK